MIFGGDVFVFNFFHVAQKENFAELWLKLFEGQVESGLIVETDERVFRSEAGNCVECFRIVLRKTVREVAMPVRDVRKVLRRMRRIHALKLVSGSKESKARRALEKVSCTRSSASD